MPDPKCPSCDYDLRGHDASGVCPECGARYAPQVDQPPLWTTGRRIWIIVQGGMAALCVLANAFAIFFDNAGAWEFVTFWFFATLLNIGPLCVLTSLDRVPRKMWLIEWGFVLCCIAMICINVIAIVNLDSA